MKRDWFNRGVRMTHQFGETEKLNDPMGIGTFDPPDFPLPGPGMKRLTDTGSPCEIKDYGVHSYRDDPSPIQKPNGTMAETNGPERTPDYPEEFGRPIPVGTKRRLGPLKTDK